MGDSMSGKIKLNGESSGSVTLQAPNSGSDITLTVPINGFGKVLQVVQATHSSAISTTSTSYVTTGLSASMTPSSTSSKILVLTSVPARKDTDNVFSGAVIGLFRGTVSGTLLVSGTVYAAGANAAGNVPLMFLDSPNTVSSQTYTIGLATGSAATTVTSCWGGNTGVIILIEVGS